MFLSCLKSAFKYNKLFTSIFILRTNPACVIGAVGNWASFFLCGWAGKLFDKFWFCVVGFSSDLAMCLPAKGWHFKSNPISVIHFFKSIDLP
ncbi:MAG: hypothetical protein DRI89_12010 [Bacteroidetes bacterium]|nr:MAG: hypothetical protein DRI89_12010 [Bacteroidota bacterium]